MRRIPQLQGRWVSRGARAARRSEGHPHRCAAGHRWQHTGPTALTCEIPAHDPESGNLPDAPSTACPRCSGREDLLIQESHSHCCPICEGDWQHEGTCVEGLVADCPWCFPKAGADPVPGTRQGLHFHYCPKCGRNSRHTTACAAPLRVALPDCAGCRALRGERRAERFRAALASPAHALRDVRRLVEALPVPVRLCAAVVLSMPIVFMLSWPGSRSAGDGSAPVAERHEEARDARPSSPATLPPQPQRIADELPRLMDSEATRSPKRPEATGEPGAVGPSPSAPPVGSRSDGNNEGTLTAMLPPSPSPSPPSPAPREGAPRQARAPQTVWTPSEPSQATDDRTTFSEPAIPGGPPGGTSGGGGVTEIASRVRPRRPSRAGLDPVEPMLAKVTTLWKEPPSRAQSP